MRAWPSHSCTCLTLQRTLAKRDVLAVRSLAGELPTVPLPLAAEITVLLKRLGGVSAVPGVG